VRKFVRTSSIRWITKTSVRITNEFARDVIGDVLE
jgi:hypothetical protein